MRTKLAMLMIVVIAALVITPRLSDAQADKPKCDPAAVIKKANELKASGDAKKDMTALAELTSEISAAHIACNGFTWTGKDSKVQDPFDLPKGAYRLKLSWTGKNPVGAVIKSVGEAFCGGLVGTEQSKEAAMTTIDDCRATLEVRVFGGPEASATWTVTLEPLK